NLSGTVTNGTYNYSAILPAGTHYWKSYANDTINQWNQTYQWNFTIAKAAGAVTLLINGSTNDFKQNVSFSANITCNLYTPTSGNLTIYEDGVVLNSTIGSTLTHIKTYTTPADYNITCILENHQNYTASDQSWVNATDENSLTVTLNNPPVGYWNNTSDPFNVTFNCSATDNYNLRNISLWITNNQNTSFGLNQSSLITGISNSSNWTVSLANGNYTWNCLAYDEYNNSAWATANRTIFINYTTPVDNPPNTTLISPADSYSQTTSVPVDVTFTCNATDDHQLQNLSLYITTSSNTNFTLNQTTNVNGVTNQTNWTLTLALGSYTWNCLAYDNASQSVFAANNRTLTISAPISPPISPPGGSSSGGGPSMGGSLAYATDVRFDCADGICEKEEEKKIDLTIIDYPESINITEIQFAIFLEVKNTGELPLTDVKLEVKLDDQFGEGLLLEQEIYSIGSLDVGESKPVKVKIKNQICPSEEGDITVSTSAKIKFTAKEEEVSDEKEVLINLNLPRLSVLTDKISYSQGEKIKACIIFNNAGGDDQDKLEFEISLINSDYSILDYLFSYFAPKDNILIVVKELQPKILTTTDYLLKVRMFKDGKMFSNDYFNGQAETEVFINEFVELRILGKENSVYPFKFKLKDHNLTVKEFDENFVNVVLGSSQKDYWIRLLERVFVDIDADNEDDLEVIYLGVYQNSADLRLRPLLKPEEEEARPFVGSAYQVIDPQERIESLGLRKGSLFPIIMLWVVITLIISLIMAVSSWAHHHRASKGRKRKSKINKTKKSSLNRFSKFNESKK
ncbi:MAG: hypothetical protein KJ597_00060, partial [Nanoarchaeota archaeon]|nr:hypothetical protein [Nanoarchaeota archaeon]